MRNSDSGVVMRMSGGLVASFRRSLAGVSPERTPTRDVRLGQPEPRRGLPDARERCAQVALDVDGQRLERRDVEDTAAVRWVCRGRLREGVDRREEGSKRLAGSGRRDDERALAGADGLPRTGLGRGGLGEGRREPGAGRDTEALQHLCCAAVRHSVILPHGADTRHARGPSGT